MSKLDKTEVLNAFEAAYEAANGKKPEITAKSGWYSVDGGKNMRLAELADLTAEMTSGKAASKPAEKQAAPAKTAKKKATQAAPAKAEKKAAFTVIRESKDGYTAEEFWIKVLAEKDHDCRLPRGVV